MPILKFLWLAIRPFSKLETAIRWWDVLNLALLTAYPTIGTQLHLEDLFKGANIAWFVGIPMVFLVIAGLKLQFRLERIENTYHYALSLDRLNYGIKQRVMDFELVLTNTLPRPLAYKVALGKLCLEINGNKQTQIDKDIKGAVISGGKSSTFKLGSFNAPSRYPCKGLLHYEIAYGHPKKLLFHQVMELNLEIYSSTQGQLGWTIGKHEDRPFKKSDFYKEY